MIESRNGQNMQDIGKLSKALSWLLRHGVEKEGFTFIDGGYLWIEDILKHKKVSHYKADDIQRVVKECEKQRFALKMDSEGKMLVRANQGHSLANVNIEMDEILSADEVSKVIHGTNIRNWKKIKSEGLSRMKRQHIHFAAGEPGESGVISGMRHSCEIYIYINIEAALSDGLKFYRSSNNVILSPGNSEGYILPCYFLKVRNVKRNTMIVP